MENTIISDIDDHLFSDMKVFLLFEQIILK